MPEINTIQSSLIDAPNNTSDADSRRYTKFDRSATDAGSVDFSFSDFLDTVNPLQHIPVISSIYRAATDSNINPVARVAGDIMYGGAAGAVSAIVAGIGAIGNSVVESETGQDVTGNVVTALIGPSDTTAQPDTQVAAATTPSAPEAAPTVTAPAPAMSTLVADTPAATATSTPAAATEASPLMAAKTFPLDRSKMAYGGVMDTHDSMSAQNLAIALSASSPGMRLGHTIYTGRLMTGAHALPVAPTTTTSADSTSASAATTAQSTPPNYTLPQPLLDDIMAMKAANQYKGIATGQPPAPGSTLNTVN